MKTMPTSNSVPSRSSMPCASRRLLALGALFLLASLVTLPRAVAQGAPVFTNLWSLSPGDRYDLSDPAVNKRANRGVAINPVTGNVLYTAHNFTDPGINTNLNDHVTVLNGTNGAFIRELPEFDEFGIAQIGGIVPLSQVGVADDGVVYACGVTLNYQTTELVIYRWENEAATNLTLAYADFGANAGRLGDSLDVRGAGTNTQIIVSGKNGGANTVLLTTFDGINFTATEFGSVAGIVFEESLGFGEGDTLLGKDFFGTAGSASNLHKASFTYDGFGSGTLALTTNIPVPNKMGDVSLNKTNGLMASVITGQVPGISPLFRVYDISDVNNPVLQFNAVFPTANNNSDGTSAADTEGDLFVGLDVNNGIVCYQLLGSATNAPVINTQPANAVVYEGTGSVSFTVEASGAVPLFYQWLFNSNSIPTATNATYTLTNPALTNAGFYSVIVSNVAGSVTSTNALLTVLPSLQTPVLTELWSLSPGDRPYLTTASLERGLAYNPSSGNLLLLGRNSSPTVYALNSDTGADLHTLSNGVGVISGGTFTMNLVGAAGDGAVYVCNLTTDASSSPLKIYRWANDNPATIPTVAFEGDPAQGLLAGTGQQRWGDTLDVRGSGTGTEIILSARLTNVVCVLTTADGVTFTPNVVQVPDAPPGNNTAFAGLGVAFGQGDTFWAKTIGFQLRQVAYELTNTFNVGTIIRAHDTDVVPSSMSAIGVDPVNQLIAGVTLESPDNLRLYDLADSTNTLPFLDQDFWPTDNPNANGTGAVDFGPNRVFALDSNNGILAMILDTAAIPFEILSINKAPGPSVVLTWESRPGVDYNVLFKNALSAPSWSTNAGSPVTATGLTTSTTNSLPGAGNRFYQIEAP